MRRVDGQMEKIRKVNKYASIDIAKFFLALLVVAIHEMPFVSYSRVVNAFFVNEICRIAVPLFFLSTGFFLAKKGFEEKVIRDYIKKILKMYIVWSGVYFVVFIITKGYETDTIIDYMLKVIGGGYAHLWYLYSSIVGVLISWLLLKKTNLINQTLIWISLILYIIGALINDFWWILPFGLQEAEFVFSFFQHLLFMATPYILLGACMNHLEDNIKPNIGKWLFVFAAMLTIENVLLFKFDTCNGYQNNVFMFPVCGCIFAGLLTVKMENRLNANKMRFFSTYIYLVQGVFIAFVDMILENSLAKYVLVLILCIGFSDIIYIAKHQRKVKNMHY